MAPRICTFESLNAPEGDRWMAAFCRPSKKDDRAWSRLPLVFYGRDEADVIAAADKFWTDEQAREEAKAKAAADRAAKRKGV
jgi:hypothetical protein